MTHAETPLGTIHGMAETEPHRALLAAVLRLALTDALGNDLAAANWLASPACRAMLEYLIPSTSGMSGEQVQAALLGRLPAVLRAKVAA